NSRWASLPRCARGTSCRPDGLAESQRLYALWKWRDAQVTKARWITGTLPQLLDLLQVRRYQLAHPMQLAGNPSRVLPRKPRMAFPTALHGGSALPAKLEIEVAPDDP